MGSSLFSIMNLLRRNLQWSRFSATRSYALQSEARKNLYSKLSVLGNPNISLLPELNSWAETVTTVRSGHLNGIIRDLRARRQYPQALEVAEWMGTKLMLRSSDRAVQLDLIARVRGVQAAETYFENLDEEDKDEKTYGALLNCYVRERLTEKALAHMQEMKELGRGSVMSYNDIMRLYSNLDQHEKVPELLAEMRENNFKPNLFSYSICIRSYGEKSDIEGMERMLEEMESQDHIDVDWYTYGVVANAYVKARLTEKATSALMKLEEKLNGDTKSEGYDDLIRFYASLGNKSEAERIWQFLKSSKRLSNNDYISMIRAWVKLGDFEQAESLLREWEDTGKNFDIRVPSMLLLGYCQKDMLEKAESMLEDMIRKGKPVRPNTYMILAAAYEEKRMMEKALEHTNKALASYPGNEGWKPKMYLIRKLLNWLGDSGKEDEVEPFIGLLRAVVPMDRKMYHTLLKVSVREGKETDSIIESMKAENIEPDEDTEEILRSSLE